MFYDYLAEFVTVARERSLSRAALKLSLSQSSLSRHMQSLETRLGTSLLHRRSDGVELTPYGLEVFTRAADMTDIMDDILALSPQDARENQIVACNLDMYPGYVRRFREGVLALGAPDKPMQPLIMPIEDLHDKPFTQALDDGTIDIYVGNFSPRRREELRHRYQVAELFHPRVAAVMEPDHPFATRDELSIADLEGQALVHAESDYHGASDHWMQVKALLRDGGIAYRSVAHTLENEADFFNSSYGPAILPLAEGYKGLDLLRAAGNIIIPVTDMRSTYYAVSRKGDQKTAQILADLNIDE